MKRTAVCLAVLSVLVVAVPARASMEIKRIQFDPSGPDDGSNRSLSREYLYLVNTGDTDVQLKGWKVVDRNRDHVYRFFRLFLSPGDTIHLRTGRGSDGAPVCESGTQCPEHAHYDLYWKLDNYVWNNDGDRARLIRPNKTVVDQCAYTASADSPVKC